MSTLEVNKITPSTGTTITLGDSGDTFTIPSGVTLTNNGSASGFGGITEADQWRLTANTSGGGGDYDITSNLARVNTDGFNYIGTGMTQSSGIFTFPSTGIYLLIIQATTIIGSADAMAVELATTTDNSTYSSATTIRVASSVSQTLGATGSSPFIFDVTDTSTHKCLMRVGSAGTGSYILGDATQNYTSITFLRLGDT